MSWIDVLLSLMIILSSTGVLISKDNFYSALYLALTMIFIATMFALFNIQPAFILIVFIAIGAVGVVTVALAAVFREVPKHIPIDKFWILPTSVTGIILCYTIYKYANYSAHVYNIDISEFQIQYFVMIVFLVCLIVLLMISVIKLIRREELCSR